MTALFAMWTPYIVEWLMALLVISGLLIALVIALTRWLFRINERIELLNQIRDELKKFNERTEP